MQKLIDIALLFIGLSFLAVSTKDVELTKEEIRYLEIEAIKPSLNAEIRAYKANRAKRRANKTKGNGFKGYRTIAQ